MEKLALMTNFPGLAPPTKFEITSPRTRTYNCIAWAAGENWRTWWPDKANVAYWPKGVEREATLAAFIAAYATLGYQECENGVPEPGVEKIAIFLKPAGTPAHAARQSENGIWSSKLGNEQDIEHELHALEGPHYGKVKQFMRRLIRKV